MATIDDVLRAQQDTNDLLRQFLNGGGGYIGGGRYIGGGSSIGRGVSGRGSFSSKKMTTDDLDKIFEDYRERLEGVGRKQAEYKLSETEKHLKLQKETKEIEESLSELYEEINDSLDRRNELLEKKENGTITEDELDELDQLNDKIDDTNKKMYEHIRLKERAGNTSFVGSMMKDLNRFIGSIKQIHSSVNDLTKPYQKVDAAASKYAKTVGMTKAGMDSLAKTSLNNVASKLASTYNISTEELLEAQSNYIKASGRNIRLDNADQENIAAMHKMGGNGNELAALYDNFGVSLEETAGHVGKMFSDASKQGLSFEKYSDNVAKNIKIAQNYTFKNGLKGLESMAKKATAMKMDMQQVAALADKVSTVEGAIDVSSQLQVLGGPFAQLADPLGMLNEGLTDMEGLQDRLIKMVGGLGSFDKETGEVKVSAFNKQRIKAASQAMGVDYGTIMESVNAQARRGEINKQIAASQVASGFDNDMKELIMNSGTIKDGKAGVSIRGQFKALEDITEADRKAIEAESRSETDDIKQAAISLQRIEEKNQSYFTAQEARQAQMYQSVAKGFGNVMKWLSKLGPLLTVVSIIQGIVAAGQIYNGITNAYRSGKGLFTGVTGKVGNLIKGRAGGASNLIGRAGNISGAVSRAVGNFATKATGGIVKGGAKRTAIRAIAKVGGKEAAKTAVKLGVGLAKGMAVAGPLGIIGTVGDVATDALVAKGKMKKGGAGHHAAKGLSGAASGAAMGAMIGSVIPGVGTAIGAVVGGVGGAIKGLLSAGKAKQERILEEKAQKLGVSVNGKYRREQLKDVNYALEQGHISKRMRKKLEKNGDHELLATIDKKAEEKRARGKEIKKRSFWDRSIGKAIKYSSPLGGFFMAKDVANGLKNTKLGKKISKVFGNKPILKSAAVGAMLGGPVGAILGTGVGGVKKMFGINGNTNKFEGKSKKSAADILSSYNTTIKPILEKGNNAKYGAVNKTNNDIHLKSDPHDININGTLNLKGQDGKTIDIVSELKNNPQMLRQVSGMISNEMGVLQKGINVVQRA